eukprot:TRINITY_DN54270_c0_g1_i1.p1 TRINITY_DN54270_c0_g1~~TRINITY_DN54270_c0_g1_i1.p1  ORF type:complete len:472 (+),score=24.40 TRINITY_DN54270_c0_g1_i1:88-1503(+)
MSYWQILLIPFGCAVFDVARCSPKRSSLPEFILGHWLPDGQSTTVLGPMTPKSNLSFTAATFPNEGDYWFTLLPGQLFRGNHQHMQVCARGGVYFDVSKITDDELEFCWPSSAERMPTHKSGCHGCDCAKMSIVPLGSTKLRFLFEMSPPAHHVYAVFYRAEGPSPRSYYTNMLSPWGCEFLNRSGHLDHARNADGDRRMQGVSNASEVWGGCGFARTPDISNRRLQGKTREYTPHKTVCQQLNGLQFETDGKIADVRFSYTMPSAPCHPCIVNYSVSAALQHDKYISVGFKGVNWNHQELPIRSDYFGMQTVKEPIVLGYASDSGGCVREQIVEEYMSHPVDVTSENALLLSSAVEYSNGRVTINFTKQEWWGSSPSDVAYNASNNRIMWAIGNVKADGTCKEFLHYHRHQRGISPLNFGGMHKDCEPLEFESQTGGDVAAGDVLGNDLVGVARVTAMLLEFACLCNFSS